MKPSRSCGKRRIDELCVIGICIARGGIPHKCVTEVLIALARTVFEPGAITSRSKRLLPGPVGPRLPYLTSVAFDYSNSRV